VYSDTVANTIKDGLSPNFERLNKTFDTYGPLNVTEIGSGFIYSEYPELSIKVNDYVRQYGTDNDPSQYSHSIASNVIDNNTTLQDLIDKGLVTGNISYTNITTKDGANSDVKRDGNRNVMPYVGALNIPGLTSTDFNIKYEAGDVTITPVTLTVIADDKSRQVREPNPVFTSKVSGFVLNDTVNSTGFTDPVLTTSANINSPAGKYDITQGTVATIASPNYDLQFIPGTLTVGVANNQIITISDATWRNYGYVGDSIQRTQPDPTMARGLTNDAWSPNDDVWQPWEQNTKMPLSINDSINDSILADVNFSLESSLRPTDNFYKPENVGVSDIKLFMNNDTAYAQASSCWLDDAWYSQRPFMDAMAKPSSGMCRNIMSHLNSVK
jgi:hypothetical protein